MLNTGYGKSFNKEKPQPISSHLQSMLYMARKSHDGKQLSSYTDNFNLHVRPSKSMKQNIAFSKAGSGGKFVQKMRFKPSNMLVTPMRFDQYASPKLTDTRSKKSQIANTAKSIQSGSANVRAPLNSNLRLPTIQDSNYSTAGHANGQDTTSSSYPNQ